MEIKLTPEQAKALLDHFWATMHYRDQSKVKAAKEAVRAAEKQLWAED